MTSQGKGKRNKEIETRLSTLKIESRKNLQVNRLSAISNKIEAKWLNLSLEIFKIRCNELFLN